MYIHRKSFVEMYTKIFGGRLKGDHGGAYLNVGFVNLVESETICYSQEFSLVFVKFQFVIIHPLFNISNTVCCVVTNGCEI